MAEKQRFSSGAIWENEVGYSRAVRAGNIIEVAGTTSVDGDSITGKGDMYAQAVFIFQKIEKILIEAGSNMKDVIRTRRMLLIFQNGRMQEGRMPFFLKK